MAKKQMNQDTDIPSDAFYYNIPLENDNLILTKEVLYKHYKVTKQNKRCLRVAVPAVEYNKDVFKLSVEVPDDKPHYVFVEIKRYEVRIACDCGMPEKMLCDHAYCGMFLLMHYKDIELEDYYWPELQQEVGKKLKYLYVDAEGHHVYIYPRPEYGNIFKTGWGFTLAHYHQFDTGMLNETIITTTNKSVLGYNLIYTELGLWFSQLPMLRPFIGKTGKNHSRIVSYSKYLQKEKALTDDVILTENQTALNEICYEMSTLAKSVGKQNNKVNVAKWLHAVPVLIKLWQKAIPMLFYEPYVQSSQGEGYLTSHDKPVKSNISDCRFSANRFVISFILKDYKEHLILKPIINLSTKRIPHSHYRKVPLFIIDLEDHSFHLVHSPQDDALLNWLEISGNKLTVLKAHFTDFHHRFLNQLSKCYAVIYQPFGSKKKVNYALDEVIPPNTENDGK